MRQYKLIDRDSEVVVPLLEVAFRLGDKITPQEFNDLLCLNVGSSVTFEHCPTKILRVE